MKKYPQYNFKSVEGKWQKKWLKDKTFQPDMDKAKKPFYNLMMFPYPSAEGLHVGGVYTFTGVDTFGRMKKLQGHDVFQPIGLDGFGIHSENYAMKIGQHILDVSKRTEKNFYRQLHEIGNMFDWSRKVETYDPDYYKWTQWIFLKMYERGLAYRKKAKVNWCPSCKTVLSDEQVISGRCERCDSVVEKKELAQWFFKITAYADRLLKNLDWIDWPEDVKTNQRNWIGKSEGALIKFQITNDKSQKNPKRQKSKESTHYSLLTTHYLKCFTTRPDTLFGATYLVVAPENTMISTLSPQISNLDEVKKYVDKAAHKTEEERKNDKKEKTGVEIKGIKAINPATNEEIPIFVADYVLGDYGTGAIMAVPAHDERDFQFARKYNLPIRQVIAPYKLDENNPPKKGKKDTIRKVVHVILENENDEVLTLKLKDEKWGDDKPQTLIIGGIEEGESPENAALREIGEEVGYSDVDVIKVYPIEFHAEFFAAHKDCNRYVKTIGVVCKLKSKKRKKISEKENKLRDIIWVKSNLLPKNVTIPDDVFLAEAYIKNVDTYTDAGILINSGEFSDLKSKEAKREMIKWLEKTGNGKKSVDYKLRDWCISRQRYWGPPIPIVWCKQCAQNQKSRINKTEGGKSKSSKKVLMVHGFEGSGEGNWLPWMKRELEKEGFEVYAPTLKNSKHPKLFDWLTQLKPYLEKLDQNSIIIGHSLGSKAVLHLLERSNKKISKLFLVASAIGNPKRDWTEIKRIQPGRDWDSVQTFWEKEIDWSKVDLKADEKHIIISRDDRMIDSNHYKVAKLSNLKIEKFDNQGHFTQKKNEELRKYILKYIPQYILKDIEPVAVPVPEKDLPVKLPPMEDFLPEGKGKGPLAKNEKFVKTKCPVCGGEAERETDVSDPFVDSSWYFFRYPSTEFKDKPFDKKRTKKWLPVDSYIGGKEHTVLHLLYSRFITMVFKDLGLIDFEEPYKRFFGHGLITKDGAKMSKSKGNVVNPDEMIEKYGADTVRLYLRFVGDFSQGGDWRDSGVEGMARFTSRLWRTFHELEGSGGGVGNMNMLDKTIKVIGEDIEKLSFNTAVARLMEFVNWTNENLADFDKEQAQKVKETLAFVLAPMAPHMAEEFYASLGNKKSIFESRWPKYDPKNIIEDEIELVIQVNGKVRDKIKASKDLAEKEAEGLALGSEKVKKHLSGKTIRKIIHVKGRLVNIVV